jgi:hypothetical protein
MSVPKKKKTSVQLSAMQAAELADLLSNQEMGPVTEENIAEWVANGAPHNPDGSFNLCDVAAWLTNNLKHGR